MTALIAAHSVDPPEIPSLHNTVSTLVRLLRSVADPASTGLPLSKTPVAVGRRGMAEITPPAGRKRDSAGTAHYRHVPMSKSCATRHGGE
jgi:hypothetical protein